MGNLFGTNAPLPSDLVAIVEVAILLLVGTWAVRRGHVRFYLYLQSSMVLADLLIVPSWMVPQYVSVVLPDLPKEWASLYYLLPTIMLVAGAAAEALGIYILLVAGTNRVPEDSGSAGTRRGCTLSSGSGGPWSSSG